MTKRITIKSGEFVKVINVVVQEAWYSIEQCKANPRSIYVFGDNLLRVGEAGQASIRSCNNAIGIATKKKPSMLDSSFFSDKEYDKLEPFLKAMVSRIMSFLIFVVKVPGAVAKGQSSPSIYIIPEVMSAPEI